MNDLDEPLEDNWSCSNWAYDDFSNFIEVDHLAVGSSADQSLPHGLDSYDNGAFSQSAFPGPEPFSHTLRPNQTQTQSQIQSHAQSQTRPALSSSLKRPSPDRDQNLTKRQKKAKSGSTRQNSATQNALARWGLDIQGRPDLAQDHQDDVASCTSSCPGSPCPSQCGAEGQGSICCNDDDCEAMDLCIDEACEGASHPCTNQNCIGDPHPAAEATETVAAATALTSIGGPIGGSNGGSNSGPNATISLADCEYWNLFAQGDMFGEHQPLQPPVASMNFACGHNHQATSFNNLPLDPSASGHHPNTTPNHCWHNYFGADLATHVLQHHSQGQEQHGSQHMRPCIADNPNFMNTRCPLPVLPSDDTMNFNFNANQNYPVLCDFVYQDSTSYAQHVLDEHSALLPNLRTHAACANVESPSLYQPMMTSPEDLYNPAMPQPQPTYHLAGRTFQSLGHGDPSPAQRHVSVSTLSDTNDSFIKSPIATPSSTPPPPLPRSEEKVVKSKASTKVSSLHGQDQAFEVKDEHRCLWRDAKTGRVCNQLFSNEDKLHDHCTQSHTSQAEKTDYEGKDGYMCFWKGCQRPTCFSQRGKLSRHLQVHTGYKPMKCSVCGLGLSAQQALDQHMRTHTNEAPYVCEFPGCNQRFKQHSALTMHNRTHTGEKPLKCDICGQMFRESSNLTKHRRTHDDKRRFQCEICHKDFNRRDQLRRHLSSNHKDHPDCQQVSKRAQSAQQSRLQGTAHIGSEEE